MRGAHDAFVAAQIAFAAFLLVGVTTTDARVLAAVAFVLFGATALASWIPARRIAEIDPGSALRDS